MRHFIDRLYSHIVVRYIISGATAAIVNLLTFTVLWHLAGIHSVVASAAAACVAFIVSFFMQKYFTFHQRVPIDLRQLVRYLLAFVLNLGLTALLFSLFIQQIPFALFDQFLAAGLTATVSFFVYRRFVFQEAARSDTAIQS